MDGLIYSLSWEAWLLWAFLWFGVGQIVLIFAIAFDRFRKPTGGGE